MFVIGGSGIMKKYRFSVLIAPIIALILEALPFGAVLIFANHSGKAYRRTFSYFDMTPFGYANFGPFITAMLTCAMSLLIVIWYFNKSKKLYNSAVMVCTVAFWVSLSPLLFGLVYFSVVGGLISLTLLAQFCLMSFIGKENKK